MPFCADTGAEMSVIGSGHLQKLIEQDRSVKLVKVNKQVSFGGHNLTSSGQVKLNMKLDTAAGTVNVVEPVDCLVVEEDDDEFILGKYVLSDLGIDVDRQLEQLAENKETVDDDPIGRDDDEPVGFDVDDDLAAAIMKLIDAAIENGFPAEYRDKLEAIVKEFDIWRLRLGNDSPAKVPPLFIRLKKGAQPV